MRIIGITGGICSGKSGVTKMVLRRGFPVIDCDKITDALYEEQWFLEELKKLFGNRILYNGEVNRGRLGSLVFSEYKEMKKLNKLCFPLILEEINRLLEVYMSEGYEYVFIDAPTLFESGLDKCVSFTDFWIVSVTKVTQIERLKRRKPYLSQKAINNIFSSQLENRERLQYATYIIPNDTRNPKLLADKVDRGLEIIGAISREDRL
jgi:dephospho-CoA kinase